MAFISLTQGYVAIVDDADLDACAAMGSWCAVVDKHTVYAITNISKPRRGTLLLHRWITKAPDGLDVDHRDGNGLNNRRGNLRIGTRSQNNANSVFVRGEVRYRGVTARRGKFMAQTRFLGKQLYLGDYATAEEAAIAYETKRIELFGDFAPSGRK
jgi:hypothetical protein